MSSYIHGVVSGRRVLVHEVSAYLASARNRNPMSLSIASTTGQRSQCPIPLFSPLSLHLLRAPHDNKLSQKPPSTQSRAKHLISKALALSSSSIASVYAHFYSAHIDTDTPMASLVACAPVLHQMDDIKSFFLRALFTQPDDPTRVGTRERENKRTVHDKQARVLPPFPRTSQRQ